jgi:hypothetical protein
MPKKGQKLTTFALNPLMKDGVSVLTVVRRTDIVVKNFQPADFNPETDEVVVETKFAKEKGLLHSALV